MDWRDEANWGCNGGKAPNGVHYYDGIDLDPYEASVGISREDQPCPYVEPHKGCEVFKTTLGCP